VGWTYRLTDYRTRTVVRDALPITCDFEDNLGVGGGSLTGTLALGAGVDADDALLPWRRVIWPIRDGVVLGAFVVTSHAQMDQSASSVKFAAARLDAVLHRREIESTLVFRDVDQSEIVRDLVRYGLGRPTVATAPGWYVEPLDPAADVPWIRLDSGLSGVLRTRQDDDNGYQAARHQRVGDIIDALSQVEDTGDRAAAGLAGAFDYRLTYGMDPDGSLYAQVQAAYPQAGHANPVLPLESPGNVRGWTYAADTADTATQWRTYGSGQGVEKMTGAAAVDREALDRYGWPLLMGSDSGTATTQETVDANGRAALAEHRGANTGWVFTTGGETLGHYELGDTASYHVQHQRWPLGKRGTVRILGHHVVPAGAGGADQVTLSVAEA
jgi:hypothetical protein